MDFAGQLKLSKDGKTFALIAVEEITRWPMTWVTDTSTANIVMEFVKKERGLPFGPPRRTVWDNATLFSVGALQLFLDAHGSQWSPVLPFAPMATGRAERMVATVKPAIKSKG